MIPAHNHVGIATHQLWNLQMKMNKIAIFTRKNEKQKNYFFELLPKEN